MAIGDGAGMDRRMSDEELAAALEGVRYCFCTVCKHDPAYGECQSCWCGNRGNAKPAGPQTGAGEAQ